MAATDMTPSQIETNLAFVCSIVTPLLFYCGSFTHQPPLRGGTAFLLDTGKSKFGVTANHVIDGYSELLAHCPNPTAILGAHGRPQLRFDLLDRILDRDPVMDIATFRLTDDEVAAIDRNFVRTAGLSWPPDPAMNSDVVFYCGFPGIGREWIGEKDVSYSIVPMGAYVTSAREDLISIQIEREKMVDIGPERMPEKFNFGGISGAPLLKRSSVRGFQFLSPAGVVIAGPNSNGDPETFIAGFELIGARPIRFINADGSLDRAGWHSARPY